MRGNGARADADYNTNGFLSLLNGQNASTSFSYELAASGKRLGITSGGQTTSYGYDNAGRLLSETSPVLPSIAYSLDAVGNRKTGAGFSYSYNANDWLLGVGVGVPTTNYGYDANGALTTVNSTPVNAYDFEGHLTQSGATHFTCDAEGNRLSQTSGGVQTFYLQDPSSGLAEVVEEYDAGGALQARYDYAGSELIREDRNGSTWYTHLDGLGSVRALSDAGGAIVATYTYDAFGNVVASTSVNNAAAANPYRYAGAAFDTSTGLYYLRARYYDPQAGRFLSQDPLLGNNSSPISLHRYLYASVDPVNKVDPTGLDGELVGTLVSTSISNTLAGIKNEVDLNVKQAFEDGFTHGVEYAQAQFLSNALFSLKLTGALTLGPEIFKAIRGSLASESSEFLTLYHVTTPEVAASIRSGGIDLTKSRNELDFGKGFYTSHDLSQVQEFGAKRFEGKPFEILEFKVPLSEMEQLSGKIFPGADAAWEQIVRAGRLGELTHDLDYIAGPLLRNVGSFLKGKPAVANGFQFSWHSEEGIGLLMRSLVKGGK